MVEKFSIKWIVLSDLHCTTDPCMIHNLSSMNWGIYCMFQQQSMLLGKLDFQSISCVYLEVFLRRTLHENFPGADEISGDQEQQKRRMVTENMIPNAKPFVFCENFRKQRLDDWPTVYLQDKTHVSNYLQDCACVKKG